jgi:hypothetical protein
LIALLGLGCSTKITVENAFPGASIQSVRWVSERNESYTFDSGKALGPGATSGEQWVSELDVGDSGPIHFELVVDGRKVALVTVDQFTATPGELTNFRLDSSTAAKNPISSTPTDPNPRPAEPTQ